MVELASGWWVAFGRRNGRVAAFVETEPGLVRVAELTVAEAEQLDRELRAAIQLAKEACS